MEGLIRWKQNREEEKRKGRKKQVKGESGERKSQTSQTKDGTGARVNQMEGKSGAGREEKDRTRVRWEG